MNHHTTPENDEGAATGQGNNPQNDTTNDLNSATEPDFDAPVIARLEATGQTVRHSKTGGYLVSRFGLSHYAGDFAALQAFAKKLGVTT